jgi:hypothetical protein
VKRETKIGRKPLGDKPLTAAEKMARHRAKMKAEGIKMAKITLTTYTQDIMNRYCEITGIPESEHISIISSMALSEWAEKAEKELGKTAEMVAKLKMSKE